MKGALINIVGQLRTREWEQEGQRHFRTEVHADEVNVLTSPASREATTGRRTGSIRSRQASRNGRATTPT